MTGGPGSSRFQVDGQKHENTDSCGILKKDCYKGVLNVYPNISQYMVHIQKYRAYILIRGYLYLIFILPSGK